MRIVLITGEQECDKCRQAKQIIGRVRERFPQVECQTLRSDEPEAEPYGVVMSPTVVVDEMIVASGRAPNERKLVAYVERVLGGRGQSLS